MDRGELIPPLAASPPPRLVAAGTRGAARRPRRPLAIAVAILGARRARPASAAAAFPAPMASAFAVARPFFSACPRRRRLLPPGSATSSSSSPLQADSHPTHADARLGLPRGEVDEVLGSTLAASPRCRCPAYSRALPVVKFPSRPGSP